MKIQKWLTINHNGSTRITQGKPTLMWNEVSLLLTIDLPNELFDKPRLEANITIPKEAALRNPITSEVTDNVAEAIKSVTGLEMNVRVIVEEEKEE